MCNAVDAASSRPSIAPPPPEVAENPNIATWSTQAAQGTPMPNVPVVSQVWQPWGDAMDAIIPNNVSDEEVQGFLDGGAEQIAEAIEEFEEG